MIKLAESITDLKYLPADPFAATVEALALTYGFGNTGFIRFYYQSNSAVMSILDGNVTLCASEDADFEELKEFLEVSGYLSVKSDIESINRLGFNISDSSFIVRYSSEEASRPGNFVEEFDIRIIYNLLSASGFPAGDFGSFKADICSRINKGTARFGGIAEDGALLACCFRLFEGRDSILLGALTTDEAARGRGLASKLVTYMCSSEKPSFLFCRNDGLLNFYNKCGFSQCGKWAITYKER